MRHGRKRVARLMRTTGIAGRCPRQWRTTTVPDPSAAARPDLVGRDFGTDAAATDTRWCGDITYINTWEGWLYLATVIDLASRRVVGWAVADHLRTDLVNAALTDAIRRRRPASGLIFHSDRGCQYTSRAFAEACTTAGVRQSMSAVGSSADNAAAESFNATFKRETLQGRRAFTDERQARLAAFRWLHRYNTVRRHSRLGQQSPTTYERTTQPAPATLAPAA
ncbi:IS3 family transposase [Micromonospora soli]|uniref:IS3 family transposase n=1 Tax=Micromonospora sp. NBRC 110009 TaxID=3061627 RepID=UPI002672BAF4|nr:IS3 family transposase [Micromonospora sp. NBRC 110009]WKU02296.1 IS3 family transposase [Micromonospora sp. NBRC 110009]